jgi:predicted glycoside hydrolase/deacetylase ChbG (UPF0249 family)
VIVTADDLGLSTGVTRGILEAHRLGAVRSTSLLVTYPSGEEGASMARAEPELEVGLHLDLVGGWPAADPGKVPSLVDAAGRFHGLASFIARVALGRVRATEVALELRAQVARARGWGTPALAWDSHRHAHALPQVARIVGPLARELGARWVRRPSPHSAWRSPKALALGASTRVASRSYNGVPGSDWFVDVSSWQPDAAALAGLARERGLGEVCLHPGYVDEELRRVDVLVGRRASDLALLTDPQVRAALSAVASWRVAPDG